MKKRKNKTALKPLLIVLACVLIIPLVLGLFSLGDSTNSGSGGGGGGSTSGGGNNTVNNSGGSGVTDTSDSIVTHTLAATIDETWIVSMQEKGQEQSDGSRLFCSADGFSVELVYFQEQPVIVVEDGTKTYDYVNATTATSLGLSGAGWLDASSMTAITDPIGITMPEGTELYLDDWSELDPLFE